MEITLIRHLPTDWNKKNRLQGKRDISLSPITEKDQGEITKNLGMLNKQSFDYVLCSELKRTKETANLYGFNPTTEPLLNELDFGFFEGRTREELLIKYGDTWTENPTAITLGESILNLENRITLFLNKYNHASNILVFGHGFWIRALKSYHQYGHVNNMNKTLVRNNECICLEFLTVEA